MDLFRSVGQPIAVEGLSMHLHLICPPGIHQSACTLFPVTSLGEVRLMFGSLCALRSIAACHGSEMLGDSPFVNVRLK